MRHVFDLDGTLVDTHQAVAEAYHLAGLEMPADAWGRPWRDWCDPVVHHLKVQAYPNCVREFAKRLPCLDALDALCRQKMMRHPMVLTGASIDAVNIIIHVFQIPARVSFKAGLTRQQKINWLAGHGFGVYVDNDEQTLDMVKEQTTWKALLPEEYLRLYWRQVPTSD